MFLFGLTLAVFQVCYLGAIARVGVTVATLITVCAPPALVAFMSVRLLHEMLTRKMLAVLGCSLLGTTLIILGQPTAQLGEQHNFLTGSALALDSAVCMTFGTLLLQRLAGRYHPLQPMIVSFGTAAIVLLPFALATDLIVTYSPLGWAVLIYLGLIPTALAYLLFLIDLRSTTVTIANVTTMFETLTSAILAWLIFGERLNTIEAIGAALLLLTIPLLSTPKSSSQIQAKQSDPEGALL